MNLISYFLPFILIENTDCGARWKDYEAANCESYACDSFDLHVYGQHTFSYVPYACVTDSYFLDRLRILSGHSSFISPFYLVKFARFGPLHDK